MQGKFGSAYFWLPIYFGNAVTLPYPNSTSSFLLCTSLDSYPLGLSMATPDSQRLHFILIPFLAQGHIIPMFDIARLLAERNVLVTIITTTVNASRFKATVDHDRDLGLPIQLADLRFPSQEVGLPDGFENFDVLDQPEQASGFFDAIELLQLPAEQYLQEHQPPPSCIISDSMLPWTLETAEKFKIPRIVFHGMCNFSLLCWHNLRRFNSHESAASDSELFPIPGLNHRIEIAKFQMPPGIIMRNTKLEIILDKCRAADLKSFGVVVNSFSDLENEYVDYYQKALGIKVWTVGPVSLCNKETLEKYSRGNKASISEHECLKWMDSRKPKSVVYVCLGSLCRLSPSQLMQIGLALEASKKPFIWVIRGAVEPEEIEKWLSEGFEERIKEMGLIIRGWAPQMLILSHPAIGGFLTHCGWNSTLESICAGVPMITWPLLGEQFLNEKLIVDVLGIGVDLGILRRSVTLWNPGEGLVTMEEVRRAVDRLMDEGEEGEERRKRVRIFGEKARMAVEEGGSSYVNMTLLIEDILDHATKNHLTELHKSSMEM